jgi:hypothetical protein
MPSLLETTGAPGSRHVLDTGPLLDYLLLKCVDLEAEPASPGQDAVLRKVVWKKVMRLKSPQGRVAFAHFLETAELLTVSGVLAEMNGHLQRINRDIRAEKQPGTSLLDPPLFWGVVQREFLRLGIKEESVDIEKLDPNILGELGPVDAALLHLVETTSGATLVTIENDPKKGLRKHCIERGLHCLRVDDVIEQAKG